MVQSNGKLLLVAALGLAVVGGCNGTKKALEQGQVLESKDDFEGALVAYEAAVKASEKDPDSEDGQAARKKADQTRAAIAVFKQARSEVGHLTQALGAAANRQLDPVAGAEFKRCPAMKAIPPSLSQFSGHYPPSELSFYGPSAHELETPTFRCAMFEVTFGPMFFQYEVAMPDADTVEVSTRRPLSAGGTWEYKRVGHYTDGRLRFADAVETRK